MKLSFPKTMRLRNPRTITAIFEQSENYTAFPIRALWRQTDNAPQALQVMFSVPKRNFKRAVMRNLIRRRMREAFRVNHHALTNLLTLHNLHLSLTFIYIGKQAFDYIKIEQATQQIIKRLIEKQTTNN